MLDRKTGDYYFNLFLNLMRGTYMNLEKDWERVANEKGLTYAQQHALWILHLDDGLTLDELGNVAFWNKSTTSALISRLEKKGFVRKEKLEAGNRTIRIFITEEGLRVLMESVNTDICGRFMGQLRGFEAQELDVFLKVLEKVFDATGKEGMRDFKKFLEISSEKMSER